TNKPKSVDPGFARRLRRPHRRHKPNSPAIRLRPRKIIFAAALTLYFPRAGAVALGAGRSEGSISILNRSLCLVNTNILFLFVDEVSRAYRDSSIAQQDQR